MLNDKNKMFTLPAAITTTYYVDFNLCSKIRLWRRLHLRLTVTKVLLGIKTNININSQMYQFGCVIYLAILLMLAPLHYVHLT